jgi:uncharacterized protein YcfL
MALANQQPKEHDMRLFLFLILLIPAACKSSTPRAVDARYDEDLARSAVVVSSEIEDKVLVQTHSARRLADGRMQVQASLSARVDSQMPVSIYTAFYDDAGGVVAQTSPEPLVLPPGSTRTYIAASAELGIAGWQIFINPLSEERYEEED